MVEIVFAALSSAPRTVLGTYVALAKCLWNEWMRQHRMCLACNLRNDPFRPSHPVTSVQTCVYPSAHCFGFPNQNLFISSLPCHWDRCPSPYPGVERALRARTMRGGSLLPSTCWGLSQSHPDWSLTRQVSLELVFASPKHSKTKQIRHLLERARAPGSNYEKASRTKWEKRAGGAK